MSKIIIPESYRPALNLYDTQRAIGTVKRLFADTLCATLNLTRVSLPCKRGNRHEQDHHPGELPPCAEPV